MIYINHKKYLRFLRLTCMNNCQPNEDLCISCTNYFINDLTCVVMNVYRDYFYELKDMFEFGIIL